MVDVIGKDTRFQKTVTCRECGNILAYYPGEVKTFRYSVMGDPSVDYYVDCPDGHRAVIRSE